MPESNRPEISLYSIVLDCSGSKHWLISAALLGWKKYTDNQVDLGGHQGADSFRFSRKNPTTSLQSAKEADQQIHLDFWCQI